MYWVGAVGRENRRFDKAEQVKESYFWRRWSESRNSTRCLLGRGLRLEQFLAQPSGYAWRANRKNEKTKKNPPLLSYGLELREREVFWGGNFCLNWCRKEENFCCKRSCFSVIATDSHIATFSATTTVRNTQMTTDDFLFYRVNTVFPWP